MPHDPAQTVSLLAATPPTLNALLRPLPQLWTHQNEGGDTWSPFEVIGHLIHCERADWMPRVRMIMQFGASRTFEPLDRWAHQSAAATETVAARLDTFARLRSENLSELGSLHLSAEDLKRMGRHPDLGEVTLSELLATWAAHDLTHLHQISRAMAHQYREAVGPFQPYLGVMQCRGHGAPP